MSEWFSGIGENISKMGTAIADNIGKILIMFGIICFIFVLALVSENIIFKNQDINKKKESFRIHRMTLIAMMSVIAITLNQLVPPLGVYLIPHMYKIEASELPCIIGAFAMGPVAGVLIEFIKVILNLLLNGTQTVFIGEFADFVMGCFFVLPASIIYFRNKKKKSAVIGLVTGILSNLAASILLNLYLLLPMYASMYYGGDVLGIVKAGGQSISGITDLFTFFAWAVAPCNLIKTVGVSVITMLIYKPISHLIKQTDTVKKA